ncbi:MAG: hypothetical protein A2498_09935 [Lentisphaerae bacterium RIFOXYC12_FULL_60_16]|nr:MAG: hypothetical protein A2498_09935 [Lentisphaerae bacterium RIFOXYC12_FULL_60_16]OGV85062.1 MAG: hypothetical protein A2340_05175 [Lentisphaerae bacterium RIFOXYB12_FULL_60_10]
MQPLDRLEKDDGASPSATDTEWREITGILRLAGVLGFSVAAAVTGGFLAGAWASRRLEQGLWPILAVVAASVVLSSRWACRSLTEVVMKPRRWETGACEERT